MVLITGFWPYVSENVFSNISWGLYNKGFWENVLVEAHGLVFEILVLGVILLWLDSRRQKNENIRKNIESLWDINFLSEPEFIGRKLGNLKRLNDAGVNNINVTNLLLKNVEVKGIIFNKSKIFGIKFVSCRLFDVNFIECKMNSCNFSRSVFKRCKLSNSYLKSANFSESKMIGLDLKKSNLLRANFISANLESADLREANLERVTFKDASLKNANIKHCKNIDLAELAKAKNLNYLKADLNIIQDLRILRPDMKQNIRNNIVS